MKRSSDTVVALGSVVVLFFAVYILAKLVTLADLTGSEIFGIMFWIVLCCCVVLFVSESHHNTKGKVE